MTTGSQADFLSRIKALLPPWFGNDGTPVLDGALTPAAASLAEVYALFASLQPQIRIATETGGFLDLASADFFGTALPRNSGETDAAFSARIRANLFPKRNTLPALTAAITNLGLAAPVIVEPWNPGEASALNKTCWNNVAGYRGSRSLANTAFVSVALPTSSGVTNAEVYAAIEAVRPAGVNIWVAISVSGSVEDVLTEANQEILTEGGAPIEE